MRKTTPRCACCGQSLPKTPQTCRFCGGPVDQPRYGPLKRFCGSSCYYHYHRGDDPACPASACDYCGVEFEPANANQRYCTPLCCDRASRLRRSERN